MNQPVGFPRLGPIVQRTAEQLGNPVLINDELMTIAEEGTYLRHQLEVRDLNEDVTNMHETSRAEFRYHAEAMRRARRLEEQAWTLHRRLQDWRLCRLFCRAVVKETMTYLPREMVDIILSYYG